MGKGVYHNHQSQKGGIKEKMNTIRKLRKNAKALSPVVASIILIAVTVAVSIAVAAWMGALVVGQMSTEQINFGTPEFTATDVTVVVKNGATSPAVIQKVYLNGVDVTATSTLNAVDLPLTIPDNTAYELVITTGISVGNNYEIKIITAKNNPFVITAIAPTL